jgi:hypothetical protein
MDRLDALLEEILLEVEAAGTRWTGGRATEKPT